MRAQMSKSLGNVIDPLGVIQDYGTDALRFTMATGTEYLLCMSDHSDCLRMNCVQMLMCVHP